MHYHLLLCKRLRLSFQRFIQRLAHYKEESAALQHRLGVSLLRKDYTQIKLLLENGVSPLYIKDGEQKNLLTGTITMAKDDPIAAQLLLDAGLNPNTPLDCGTAPLIAASSLGRTEIVKLLLGKGADMHVKDKESNLYSPLVLATIGGHAKIVTMLLAAGANINEKTYYGLGATPLELAVFYQRTETVKALVDYAQRNKIKFLVFKEALEDAKKNKLQEVIEILKSYKNK